MSLMEQIERAHAEDIRTGRKVHRYEEVPPSYEAITPEWLTAILCRGTPGAEIVSHALAFSSDGTSNRQRILLDYNEAGRTAGLPRSVFCKGAMSLPNRLLQGMAATSQTETNFFATVRPRLTMQAPEAYHWGFDPRTQGFIIVMKDMSETADFFDETTAVDWARAVEMVEALADLHAGFYESDELGTASLPFMTWWDWMHFGLAQFPSYGEACDLGFERAEAIIPPRLFAQKERIWPLTLRSIDAQRDLPRTITHCDVHLKNWYHNGGRVGLMDWQCMTIGHWSRDFIYAMTTALTHENRRAWLDRLLATYLARLAAGGVPVPSADEAMRLCRQQLMTALSFWTITLNPASLMPEMQPNSTTLVFIERISAAIVDLDALSAFG